LQAMTLTHPNDEINYEIGETKNELTNVSFEVCLFPPDF
jgi:hypothetical protein